VARIMVLRDWGKGPWESSRISASSSRMTAWT